MPRIANRALCAMLTAATAAGLVALAVPANAVASGQSTLVAAVITGAVARG